MKHHTYRLLASAREQDFREGYRDLGGHPLMWIPQDDTIRRAYWAYMASPLGGGMIEKAGDIIVGEGFGFTSDDERIQQELDNFWEHPYHDFSWHQDRHVKELATFGELCLIVETHPTNGDITVAEVHPYAIERTIVDARNTALVAGVKLKRTQGAHIYKTAIPAGYTEEDIFCEYTRDLRQAWTVDGEPQECFFWAINERSVVQGDGYDDLGPSLRGTTDLLASLDWIFSIDTFLDDMLKRSDIASKLLYDIECTEMSKEQIKEYIETTTIPDEYTLNGHSANIKWQYVVPQLNAAEHETSFRIFRNYAISGKGGGFPGHWFGDGGDVNRATAAEMYFPTIIRLRRRQWKIARIFRTLAAYRLFKKGLDHSKTAFGMDMTEIKDDDREKAVQYLKNIAGALAVAEDRTWIKQDEGRAAFRAALKNEMKKTGYDLQDLDDYQKPDETSTGQSAATRVTQDYKNTV